MRDPRHFLPLIFADARVPMISLTLPAMLLLLIPAIGTGDAGHENVVKDGEYVGLEKLPNLTPDVQDIKWFHENTLLIRNDEALLDKVPVAVLHGKKTYSASDGGFLTYRAKFTRKDRQNFVSLRLFESDYVMFPADKHDQYTEIKTYAVTFASNQIQFDGVRYKPNKAETWKLDRLLPLLNIESLEISDVNLPTIVVDSMVVTDHRDLIRAANSLESASCNGGYHYLERPTTVGDFVGGKVKSIRVLRTAPFRPGTKPPTPDEVRQRLKTVWQRTFQVAFCQIAWAEMTFWSVAAVVEFEDGKQSPLITDGVHVALQNYNGNSAFFRLLPAAQ